jgi:hypothetical protein
MATQKRISPLGREYVYFSGSDANDWNVASPHNNLYAVCADNNGYIYAFEAGDDLWKVGTGAKGTVRGQVVASRANAAESGGRSAFYDWEYDEVIHQPNNASMNARRFRPSDLAQLGALTTPNGVHSLWKDRVIPDRYYGTNTSSSSGTFYVMRRSGNSLIVVKSFPYNVSGSGVWGGDAINGIQYMGHWSAGHQIAELSLNEDSLNMLYSSQNIGAMMVSFMDDGEGNMRMYIGNHTNTNGIYETVIPFNILGPSSQTIVYVAQSDDGINFGEFVRFDEESLPQARYLKFRAEISGGVQEGEVFTFEFDQNKSETTVELDDFLESVGSNIRYKTVYNHPMTRDVSHADGELYEVTIDKTQWKKITKLLIK